MMQTPFAASAHSTRAAEGEGESEGASAHDETQIVLDPVRAARRGLGRVRSTRPTVAAACP
jgi:hypothetical protein